MGRLKRAMYGTRDAPLIWQKTLRKVLNNLGFQNSVTTACLYFHKGRDLQVVAHVDDLLVTGELTELEWLSQALAKEFSVKTSILGPGAEGRRGECTDGRDDGAGPHVRRGVSLGRIIEWHEKGLSWEGDQKHVQKLLEEGGLELANGVLTPGVSPKTSPGEASASDEEPLSPQEQKEYRRGAAMLNYVAQDRPDMPFAAKEVSRWMSAPTAGSAASFKRAVRYLRAQPRTRMWYEWQEPVSSLRVFSDSDWAGCVKTRRSTTGGVIMAGQHWLGHWSRTQANVALSSGEAELNAAVTACSEGRGLKNMVEEMHDEIELEVIGDSSASMGILNRMGAGRVKHLEVKQLWVQEAVARKVVKVSKIPRRFNLADSLTHHWTRPGGTPHFWRMSLEWVND